MTTTPDIAGGRWAWAQPWRATLALVLGVLVLRLAYLAWFCPYTLIEDEAHYWEWSRRLDWAYYSKGPGVAWLIACTRAIAGDTELGVRLGAPFCGGIAVLALASLAGRLVGDGRARFAAAAVLCLMPAFQSTSMLLTIDGPYGACWTVVCLLAWIALERRSAGMWAACGLALAAGFVFKYTILLLMPGLVIAAWRHRGQRQLGGVLVAAAVSLMGLVPVAIWNAQRGWPTIRHLLGHLGLPGGDVAPTQGGGAGYHYSPKWTLEFVGTQLALAGPMLLLVWIGWRAMADRPTERRFALWCGMPLVLFYLAVSVIAEPEGNWAIAAYLSWTSLAAAAIVRTPNTRGWRDAWFATLGYGLIAGLGMLRLDLLAKLPLVGPKVPVTRFMGADKMAAHVERMLKDLEARGEKPFVVSQFYGRSSQMAFYLSGHPTVYCSGSLMGGRKNQYDMWPQTSLADASLAGRAAVLLGDATQDWSWGFKSVTPMGKLDGDTKRNREAFIGTGYSPITREGGR